ncbi:CRISPR-associated endonuclease Cas1 [Pseudoalteromonas sp. MMG013]|uniref:CRISPR-associated endonuclease Cas1 n=1 Tax=Pseudoalteromonas sp. MMG013 TaxID=2822687 RepID=UPI001B39B40E|nr:CRISPR-associated endonuclease Cas1 [Pseudoalteromonas sp. MMG013]MBQ4863005.1 CRISPR-associated endonuclease Cas1 [Pseudoalteromonas sp. MMG013]
MLKTLYLTHAGSVVGIRGNRAYLSFESETIKTWPLSVIDSVIVLGRVQLTTDFMAYCCEHNIGVVLASSTGRFRGELNTYPSLNLSLYKQIQHFGNKTFQRNLSETLLQAKFENASKVLKGQLRRTILSKENKEEIQKTIQLLQKAHNKIIQCKTREQHFLLEGQMAKQYFTAMSHCIDNTWHFLERNRLPPKDPINAMLSLGYNLLSNNILCMVRKHGLHPDCGILHCGDYQPNLVLDLMEPFRSVVVDACVLKLINKGQVTQSDFVFQSGQCQLTSQALKCFISEIEKKFSATFQCKQSKHLLDYRKAMDNQILSLKAHLLQKHEFITFRVN